MGIVFHCYRCYKKIKEKGYCSEACHEKSKEKMRAYQRAYYQRPDVKENQRAYQRAYYQKRNLKVQEKSIIEQYQSLMLKMGECEKQNKEMPQRDKIRLYALADYLGRDIEEWRTKSVKEKDLDLIL